MQQELRGGITPEQYRWLKVRLGTSSDAEAMRILDVSKDRVRRWKGNHAFRTILTAIAADKLMAFRLLTLSLAEQALEAMEFLLRSPKGTDKKAGLALWGKFFQLGAGEEDGGVALPQQIFNILNIRGDVPEAALMLANPKPRRSLPTPVILDVEVSDVAEA